MLEKLKQVNWILFVLIALGMRALVSADMAQALVVIAFSGLYGFKMHLDSKEVKDINSDVKTQLDEMKTAVAGLSMKNAAKPQQMQQEIRRFF